MTLGEIVAAWGADTAGNAASSRWASTRRGLLSRLSKICGDRPLAEIAEADVWAFRAACVADGLAPRSINLARAAFYALLRDLEEMGEVDPPHALRLRKAFKRAKVARVPGARAYTPEERDAILEHFRDQGATLAARYRLAFVGFLFATGMRENEALGLEWSDVDLRTGYCEVQRTRDGTDGSVGQGKTEASARGIFLSRAAMAYLSVLPHEPPAPARWRGSQLIFRSANGCPLNANNFRKRAWKPALAALGIDDRGIYGARHTFISVQLLSRNMDEYDVADYCGTSPEQVRETYRRYFPRAIDIDAGLELGPRAAAGARPTAIGAGVGSERRPACDATGERAPHDAPTLALAPARSQHGARRRRG